MVQNPQGQVQPQQGQQPAQPGQIDLLLKAYIDFIITPVGQGLNQLHQNVPAAEHGQDPGNAGYVVRRTSRFNEDVRALMAKF